MQRRSKMIMRRRGLTVIIVMKKLACYHFSVHKSFGYGFDSGHLLQLYGNGFSHNLASVICNCAD